MTRVIIYFLFFLSGFSGLLYEVVWIRIFGLVFGNTTLAISTVLTAFMMGLALGSLILGKYAAKIKNHLKYYAFLEFGVGISALLVPSMLSLIDAIFSFIQPNLVNSPALFFLFKFVLAFLVMFPATFLMGGTLPVLSHALVRSEGSLGLDVGNLYGINTFGAMTGSLITGFFLIRMIGVFQSIGMAVVINIVIAAIALMLSKQMDEFKRENQKIRPEPAHDWDNNSRLIFWIMAISGFTALAYQVLWSRLLVFVFTNSVYAFAVILTSFLFGIALGSSVIGRLVDRSVDKIRLLGWIEIGIGLGVLIASFILINIPDIHQKVFNVMPQTSWWYWNGIRFFEAFLVMFIPTFLMGASFPVASKIIVPNLSKVGHGLGALYFFNTLGGVIGAFLAGFFFITIFGTSTTMAFLVLINLAVGGFLILHHFFEVSFKLKWGYSFIFLVLIISVFLFVPETAFTVNYSITEKEHKLIDYREGIEGTVTVHQKVNKFENNKRIDVDGLNVAGTSFMLRTLQILQGHLPIFTHGETDKVLQIGFGTGQTSHSALLHNIDEFKLIEISPNVLDLSMIHFQELNEGVLESPKFKYTIMDGKNYIKYTNEMFDVIMNDANYAVATGSASLFTKDHFEYCMQKLEPNGILSTWMTTDLDPLDFKIVLKTFQTVFPHCLLWMAPNCINKQVVLMGSSEPLHIDFQQIQEVFEDSTMKSDFSKINICSPYDLLSCILLDSEGIKIISADAAINTDNHPILEFSTRAIRSRDFCAFQNLSSMLTYPPNLKNLVAGLPQDPQKREIIEANIDNHYRASRQLFIGMMEFYQGKLEGALNTLLNGSRMIPESNLAQEFFKSMDKISWRLSDEMSKNPKNLGVKLKFARQQIALSKFDLALQILKDISMKVQNDPDINYEIARCHLGKSSLDSATVYLLKSLASNEKLSSSWYFLGEIHVQQNKFSEAKKALQKAVLYDPRMYEALNTMGEVYLKEEKFEEAIKVYKKSLSIMEFQPLSIANLADCYLRIGDITAALDHYKKSIRIGNNQPSVFFGLGNAYYFNKEYEMASNYYRKAISIDSNNGEYHYNLGNSCIMQGGFAQAIEEYKKAVKLNPNEPDYFNNLAMSYKELGQLENALRVFNDGLRINPKSELLAKNAEETKKLLSKN